MPPVYRVFVTHAHVQLARTSLFVPSSMQSCACVACARPLVLPTCPLAYLVIPLNWGLGLSNSLPAYFQVVLSRLALTLVIQMTEFACLFHNSWSVYPLWHFWLHSSLRGCSSRVLGFDNEAGGECFEFGREEFIWEVVLNEVLCTRSYPFVLGYGKINIFLHLGVKNWIFLYFSCFFVRNCFKLHDNFFFFPRV